MNGKSISELRKMTLAELEAEYDRQTPMVATGLDFVRREIEWRHQAEQNNRIERFTRSTEEMTRTIKWLTLAAVISSVVSVGVSLLALNF